MSLADAVVAVVGVVGQRCLDLTMSIDVVVAVVISVVIFVVVIIVVVDDRYHRKSFHCYDCDCHAGPLVALNALVHGVALAFEFVRALACTLLCILCAPFMTLHESRVLYALRWLLLLVL